MRNARLAKGEKMQGTRITLNLDDDIHEYLKRTAAANGQTMGRVLSDLLRKGLNLPKVTQEVDTSNQEVATSPAGKQLPTAKVQNSFRK
jgi:negative regulator of replication initiation